MKFKVGDDVSAMINKQPHKASILKVTHPYYTVMLHIPIKYGSAEPTETIRVHKKHVNVAK